MLFVAETGEAGEPIILISLCERSSSWNITSNLVFLEQEKLFVSL